MFSTDGNEQDNGSQSSAVFKGNLIGMEVEQPDLNELAENPYIMSDHLSVGPLSFIDQRQEPNMLAPPPKYFTNEFI